MIRQDNSSDFWTLFDIPPADAGGVSSYLRVILERCTSWFEAQVASVFVVDGEGVFRCEASIGTLLTRDATIKTGRGIAGSALELGQAMLIEDPENNPLLSSKVHRKRVEIGSAMVVPLIYNQTRLGVLNLARSEHEKAFDASDLGKANALASQIALAVANWQLVDEIKAANDHIRSVFELLSVAVIVIHKGEITMRNPKANEIFGYRDYVDILAELPRDLSTKLNLAVVEAEHGHQFQSQANAELTKTSWNITASPLADGGVVLVVEDISATVYAAHELSRVKRLAEIGQMTAAIAHEIKNPLTGIRSAAQMMQLAPDQAEELGSMIEQEAVKLDSLCTQFLEFAKPAEPIFGEYELSHVAERLIALISSEFEEAGVSLRLDIVSDPIQSVDRNQIEQVMRNFLINALHVSSRGSEVSLTIYKDGFEVKDEGFGMDSETQKKLFLPFFTTKASGTGLGLSNCRKIVEAHGAEILVDSKLGFGTTFRVQFANNIQRAA